MTRRADSILAAMAGFAAAAAMLCPAAASAGTQCKSVQVSSGSLTEDQAIAAWSTKVRQSYGSAWSDFNRARNQRITEQPLPPVNMYFVSAYPCRKT